MIRVVYLHGFASGPSSSKARYFRRVLENAGAPVDVPDLAAGDFEHLTVTGQLRVIENAAGTSPIALIGSSMGGYLAALYAAGHPQVSRLVLLAPAFGFAQRWRERFGAAEVEHWQRTGTTEVYHYGDGCMRRLAFGLLPDADRYPAFPGFPQPALIFHGAHDDVVPVQYAEEFAGRHANARLEVLDSGHDLLDQLDYMAAKVIAFLQ